MDISNISELHNLIVAQAAEIMHLKDEIFDASKRADLYCRLWSEAQKEKDSENNK